MNILCFIGFHRYNNDYVYTARTQKNKRKKILSVSICQRCGKALYTNKVIG